MAELIVNPDCVAGKHANCDGGWDVEQDAPCACPCACHDPEGEGVADCDAASPAALGPLADALRAIAKTFADLDRMYIDALGARMRVEGLVWLYRRNTPADPEYRMPEQPNLQPVRRGPTIRPAMIDEHSMLERAIATAEDRAAAHRRLLDAHTRSNTCEAVRP